MIINYTYVIRTPAGIHFTNPTDSLVRARARTESKLVQLASIGELSIEEVGTRIAAANQFFNDIKERNQINRSTVKRKRVGTVGTRRRAIQRDDESDDDFQKRLRRNEYAYQNWLKKKQLENSRKQ